VHLISSLNISYPYLIKFHDFVNKSQEGDEASNEGCNSFPTGYDLTLQINSNLRDLYKLPICF
jgi:hypothetical protein